MTKEVVTITDHGYINALSVCALLQKLHDLFPSLPIVVIMDNDRYQRCALIVENAQTLGIQIIFLPPYFPNLNSIERLWKFVKKKALYNQYYAYYEQFHIAILNYLEQTSTTYKQNLKILLVAKFQSFKNATIHLDEYIYKDAAAQNTGN